MKHIDYKTQGTCSRMIHFDLDDENRIHNLSFDGGCNGQRESEEQNAASRTRPARISSQKPSMKLSAKY